MSYDHFQRITFKCDGPGCKAQVVVVNKDVRRATDEIKAKGWGRTLVATNGGNSYDIKHYCPGCTRAKQKPRG
jgi:hypothetical protein